ncbi:ABC transporter permease [Desulfogranum mediterraneum]|uniref:ABC transporter permease n=1 Tax=Desulfogranum mediterraneum TaxID=160661 RepID=UPI00042A7FD3|nr:FtsX-like permease family protein [Desulfogranum mediterraneum]
MDRLPPLPLAKSFEIAYKSIKARFFRSLITTTSLVLAVAFLCYIQVCTDLANALLASGTPEAIQALIRGGFDLSDQTGTIGESAKQQWLVVLSLLVCVVGIVNAQLMAVTERFREIGTMKCLGALDRVVLLLFLIEASLQGLVGASAGALLGAIAGVLSSLASLGSMILTDFPWTAILSTTLKATLIGCLLSLIGVIYPAIKAARMEPVEAMRVEQ